ncbi:hypothetical protein [Klebsiella pneumoniae IS46]|nr:hypothetical protein [Klebsiella pneumoniae IS46]
MSARLFYITLDVAVQGRVNNGKFSKNKLLFFNCTIFIIHCAVVSGLLNKMRPFQVLEMLLA